MQSDICTALETADGHAKFKTDTWQRTDSGAVDGGGGTSKILENGRIFEKAGVNFSEVYGNLPDDMSLSLVGIKETLPFYATGTSLVIHPQSPQVPTIHANIRYLEVADKKWVGGGIDLTPYCYNPKIFKEFHQGLKEIFIKHPLFSYEKFKIECDNYFRISHRNESRGIGGIFFDYLGRDDALTLPESFNFALDVASSFNDLYIPLVKDTEDMPFSEQQKRYQLIRRGRYVEFNLVYDRGTLFGLKTNGRVESILMSLPPFVAWEYDYKPLTEEELNLSEIFKNPVSWS